MANKKVSIIKGVDGVSYDIDALTLSGKTYAEIVELINAATNGAVVLKGTLGTGGTITTLETAAAANCGHAYKVIADGTYASQVAKVGDLFICYKSGTSSYAWMLIPAGDDLDDTWRPIKVNGTQVLANGTTTNALNLKAGTNMTLTNSNGTVTFDATDTGATTVSITGDGNAFTNAEYNASTRTITFTKGSKFLTAETDTLQTVTTRGATTDKAITTAGLTTTSTLYITGTTGHREGIRIAPFGNLSSIWWNATGTQDYTTGQMWGITAYDKSYTIDATKTNTFRFRGPTSSTATSATDQMWINTSGLVTSRGGFAKSGSSNSYVLLAGGGTKALSEFALGGNIQVKSGDILAIANNELSTTYSITTSVAVGNLAKGTTVNGSVKDLLDLVFGTPTTISNLTLTAASGSFEKGTTKSLTKAVVKVGKGTAKTLDKIEIKSGSKVLASITSVVEGNNTITIPSTNITSDTTITALLTYDTNNSKSTTASYSFFFYSYYGAVASNASVDNITYTSLTKKNGKTSLKVTMSNQCAVLAIPGTVTTIKDENNFDCTGNFSKTTKTIINSLGASTSYTVFKLITPVSGTKTYTVS